jgi:hypothetical protein
MPVPVPEAPKSEERPKAREIPPAPVTQGAPPVRTAPADRWDDMARELAVCDEKNAIAGAICVDSIRRKYCTDYWDKVPQCRVTGIKP